MVRVAIDMQYDSDNHITQKSFEIYKEDTGYVVFKLYDPSREIKVDMTDMKEAIYLLER